MDFEWEDVEKKEEDEDEEEVGYKPTYVLLAIDVDPLMFETEENGRSPFQKSLFGLQIILNKMLLRDKKSLKSPLGVVLATNDESKFNLIKFSDNLVEAYNTIKNLCKMSNNGLRLKFERTAPLEMDQFLTNCQREFEVNNDVYKRILTFLTNEDCPKIADDVKFRSLNIAQSFLSHKLYLEICTFNKDFDYECFYKEMLKEGGSMIKKEFLTDDYNFASKINELIVLRLVKKHMRFYPKINDAQQFFEMHEHHFVKPTKLFNNFHVSKDTKEPVIKRRAIAEPNDEPSQECSVLFHRKKHSINITPEEKLLFKSSDLPKGYTFLYADKRKSKFGEYLEKPYFLENNPDKPNNQFFSTFWQYCFDKERVLVCARKHLTVITYVELIPEVYDQKCMFLVVALPCSRWRNYTCHLDKKPEQSNSLLNQEMSKIIGDMTVEFNCKDYYKYSLRKKMAYIKYFLTKEPMEDVEPVEFEPKKTHIGTLYEFANKKRALENEEEEEPEKWIAGNITGYVPGVDKKIAKPKKTYSKKPRKN